jgi:hypothetical protein
MSLTTVILLCDKGYSTYSYLLTPYFGEASRNARIFCWFSAEEKTGDDHFNHHTKARTDSSSSIAAAATAVLT